MKKALQVLVVLGLVTLTGCAVGAAASAYSINARSADSLSSEAADRLVARAKEEVLGDLVSKGVVKAEPKAEEKSSANPS
jgi:hypothetical protein